MTFPVENREGFSEVKLRGPRVHTVLFFDSHISLSYPSFLSHGHFSVCSKKKKNNSFNYLLISNLPLRLTYFAYIMYVVYDYVCVPFVRVSQNMSCSLFPSRFPHPHPFFVGIWTGRLLPSALPEEAAGPAVAQLPGHH